MEPQTLEFRLYPTGDEGPEILWVDKKHRGCFFTYKSLFPAEKMPTGSQIGDGKESGGKGWERSG